MAKRKKTFPCGHKGYGTECRTCSQEQTVKEQTDSSVEDKKQQRAQWKDSFKQDVINLKDLPTKKLVLKARSILDTLSQQSCHFRDLKGKRLNYNRSIISVPIDNDYRILFKEENKELVPIKILSHEQYNVKKPGIR